MEKNKKYLLVNSIVSALFFWLAWPMNKFIPLIFVVFVPLMLMERYVSTNKIDRPFRTIFNYTYFTFFLWNVFVVWWISLSTIVGGIATILYNGLVLSLPFILFFYTKKYLGQLCGYLSLFFYWITTEYGHLNWKLSFPWFNFGNAFACFPEYVQWYEYTGIFGGTIWVLVANIAIYHAIVFKSIRWKLIAATLLWIFIPAIYGYHMYRNYIEDGKEIEIVAIQPNIDPETGRFLDTNEMLNIPDRMTKVLELYEKDITPTTQFLVWPEAFLDILFLEDKLHSYVLIDELKSFLKKYPQLSLITGIRSAKKYDYKATKTSIYNEKYGFLDCFNSALFFSDNGESSIYHKSKLVPAGEFIPIIYTFNVPEWLGFGKGIYFSSFAVDNCPVVFFNNAGIGVAPVVCYEVLYGDYLSKFIRLGASIMAIITIDAWWKDTPGYKQIFNYARLMAVQFRRSVARSSAKGISGFINQRGDVLDIITYDKSGAVSSKVKANSSITFYAKHGDYIAKISFVIAILLAVLTSISFLKNRCEKSRKKDIVKGNL